MIQKKGEGRRRRDTRKRGEGTKKKKSKTDSISRIQAV